MERIEKFLSRQNICSRQDAKRLLRQKNIYVNDQLITKSGFMIDPEKDQVEIDGVTLNKMSKEYYLILNKPAGYITSKQDPGGQPTVYELLPIDLPKDLHAVGRLDLDSTGLLLFTNNGTLTHRLTHPKHHIEKEYEVNIQGILKSEIKNEIEKGIILDGKKTKPCKIFNIQEQAENTLLHIILTEGKHRQIRRIFAKYNLPVTSLKRIRLGEIHLGNLTEGQFRVLSNNEIAYLKQHF
ncbi:MAG: rRNA pseudouridine synthase [Candidatus Margulisbacteria bacterium]|nr:rRNA pseudouridine synthase [Candidatus Margulisiibacteriota bacterium]